MKYGTCNEYFEDWTIEAVFEYCAELGFDGVEIAPYTLAESVDEISSERRKEIKQAASSVGVEIIGLHWLLISPIGLYMNHPDDDLRNRTRDYFRSLVRFCGDLGGSVMIFGSPQQRNVQDGWDYQETWDRTRSVFEDCLQIAEENEVYLCIEPLSKDQTNMVTTAAEARKLVAEIDHPNFQAMVDVRSGSTEELPVSQLLEETADHLYHVHINDASGRGPGFGDTDFTSILQTLKKLKYDRYASVEVFDFKPDPRTIAATSLGYCRGIEAALG